MKVYLLRHGEYTPRDHDPQCGLSDRGKNDIQKLAKFLSPLHIRVDAIYHSGILRAQQTAEIIATGISSRVPPQAHAGLQPEDSVQSIAYEIAQSDADLFLVGHLPFMERLVGKLVSGDERNTVNTFQPGTLVCLEKMHGQFFLVSWVISPGLVK